VVDVGVCSGVSWWGVDYLFSVRWGSAGDLNADTDAREQHGHYAYPDEYTDRIDSEWV
jgi:hypothetical protein